MRKLACIVGCIFLIAIEIFRVYFIMPFPGSQQSDTISLAYFLDRHIGWLRIVGWLLVLPGLVFTFWPRRRKGGNRPKSTFSGTLNWTGGNPVKRKSMLWPRIALVAVLVFYGIVFYMFNYRFLADKMFLQPGVLSFESASALVSDSVLRSASGPMTSSMSPLSPLSAGSTSPASPRSRSRSSLASRPGAASATSSSGDGMPVTLVSFRNPVTLNPAADSIAHQLVITCTIGGESKAYPIRIIGYHHQVRDSIGGQPVMVTYCTVCRTGRVYRPLVDSVPEKFRLVGMDHFNAMFEDSRTHSWWRQATGEAIAGPLKGHRLQEIPSDQMQLGDWLRLHPNGKFMVGDPAFQAKYDSLHDFDEGVIKSHLEKRDSASWQFKSWVVGVTIGGKSHAYDWNELVKERVIIDSAGGKNQPHWMLVMEGGNDVTYHALAIPDGVSFKYDPGAKLLSDLQTNSHWSSDGRCYEGTLAGRQLAAIQSYQEFWHSWRTFHPGTSGGEISAK